MPSRHKHVVAAFGTPSFTQAGVWGSGPGPLLKDPGGDEGEAAEP